MDKNPIWKLELILIDPTGRVYTRSILNVEVYDMPVLKPPHELDGHTFDSVVQLMKDRNKRTTYIRESAAALGRHMAERLEDKEGWHGESRAATIDRQDRGVDS